MNQAVFYSTLVAIIGSGLIAGTFFVFSVAVMEALRRLPENVGISAMQSINLVIQNPIFLGVFLGTALVSLGLVVFSLLNWNSAASGFILAGAVLYFAGTFLVTSVFNVPLNNTLAAVDATSSAGHEVWNDYLQSWTTWNHVRTLFSIASMVTLIFALLKIK